VLVGDALIVWLWLGERFRDGRELGGDVMEGSFGASIQLCRGSCSLYLG
jgi:hypothetical protein